MNCVNAVSVARAMLPSSTPWCSSWMRCNRLILKVFTASSRSIDFRGCLCPPRMLLPHLKRAKKSVGRWDNEGPPIIIYCIPVYSLSWISFLATYFHLHCRRCHQMHFCWNLTLTRKLFTRLSCPVSLFVSFSLLLSIQSLAHRESAMNFLKIVIDYRVCPPISVIHLLTISLLCIIPI